MKKGQNGFTLIEVIVSFAVLAIVSGAILQMFVVSTNVNRRAYDVDKANAIAVKVQEAFKQDPSSIKVTDEGAVPELIGAFLDGSTISASFDKDWNPVSFGAPEALYTLTAARTLGSPNEESNSYHPPESEADFIWRFGTLSEYDLIINESRAQLVGGTPPGEQTILNEDAILMINNGGVPIESDTTINVFNNTEGKVDIYIFDAEDKGLIHVFVNEGYASYTIVESIEGEASAEALNVVITRNSDGVVLAESSGERYFIR